MNKLKWIISLSLTLVVILSLSCTPKPTPPSNLSSPGSVAPTSAPAKAVAPSVSADEAAWNKVLEAAKKEGKVTVYSYSWVGDAGIAISRAFESKYGIGLDIITGRGAEFVERLKTERRMGVMTADTFEGSATHVTNAKVADTIASSAAGLPAIAEKGVWTLEPLSQDKDGYVLAFMPLVGAPYINTKQVKAEDEPKSWLDIMQPRWKGQMMMQDPAISTGAYRLVGYVRYGVFSENFLKQLINQDIKFTTGVQQEAQLLAQGQRSLSLFMVEADSAALIKEGAPIKAVSMKEGVVALAMAIGQVKNNPHPNATRVFLNWLFSQEGQRVNAQAKSSSSIRNDVQNFTPPAARVQTKLLPLTGEMQDEQTKLFAEKYLVKLLGR